MRHATVLAVVLLLSSALAQANPVVTGSTILWPVDGWYQVQVVNNIGIIEVCAGTRSCDVIIETVDGRLLENFSVVAKAYE